MNRVMTHLMPATPRCRPCEGFTLIELLVALAIFAILSVMAYRGLDVVLTSERLLEKSAEQISRLQTTYRILGRDFEQAASRAIRDAFGDRKAAMVGDETRIEFTRTGHRNPADLPRSRLQRVAYHVDQDQLQRTTWPVLDQAQDTQTLSTNLIDDVEEIHLKYIQNATTSTGHWPPEGNQKGLLKLPLAIEVKLKLISGGELRWMFRIPQGEVKAGS